jgi:2-keto-4-pentenoate hydratase
MNAGKMERAATALKTLRNSSGPALRLLDDLRPIDISEGYDLQGVLSTQLESSKGICCGHKIGCTTPVMQEFLNILHPCAGRLYAHEVYEHSVVLRLCDFIGVGVECEIALRLRHDIIPSNAPHTELSVLSSVGTVMAAAEIVDNRYIDFIDFGIPSLVADDFFSSGAVLGVAVSIDGLNLAAVQGTTLIDGVEIASGLGNAVMGNPLNALAWLANQKSERGEKLKAGEVIMTGSVVETEWIDKPCEVICRISPLGEVRLNFI